jgi:cell wall-associated NlpC family hydrolase
MMRFLLSVIVLSLAASVASAEPADNAEVRPDFIERSGLVARLDSVRQNMSSAATELVVNAMGFLGVPYRFGGNTVDTGFDCSGFVRSIYEQSFGLLLPRRAAEQARATTEISREELKPGDLVFFNTMRSAFSHVGIYIGDNKFIHSPRTGERVRVDDMRQSYWTARFNGARRVEAGGQMLAPAR